MTEKKEIVMFGYFPPIQAVVLISVMSLNSYYTPCLRVSDGIKRTLEVVASGALTGKSFVNYLIYNNF